MGDDQRSYLLQQPPPPPRRKPRVGAAELRVGRIVRKDRHSKVCTSRGPRDRRVRLSAHTAIQFYDVQDRLGYDRPSKAVDWLIQNAKRAIDEISNLPRPPPPESSDDQPRFAELPFGIVPPSLETDAIADTIRLFFPVGRVDGASSSDCPPQDLRLSLQSLQETSGSLADHTVCVWPEQSPVNWTGYVFQAQQTQVTEGPFTTQRCPLQSNGGVRGGWMEPAAFAYSPGEFPGFSIPARIRGEEEHDGGCPPLHLLVADDHGNGKRDRQ